MDVIYCTYHVDVSYILLMSFCDGNITLASLCYNASVWLGLQGKMLK